MLIYNDGNSRLTSVQIYGLLELLSRRELDLLLRSKNICKRQGSARRLCAVDINFQQIGQVFASHQSVRNLHWGSAYGSRLYQASRIFLFRSHLRSQSRGIGVSAFLNRRNTRANRIAQVVSRYDFQLYFSSSSSLLFSIRRRLYANRGSQSS